VVLASLLLRGHERADAAVRQLPTRSAGDDVTEPTVHDLITDRADDLVERRCATFDPTRTYRYTLERHWGDAKPAVFVMLNPSTADAFVEDPTIRRCQAFAKREGCGGLIVVNLFALRATDPKALYSHPDPVGPLNDGIVHEAHYQGSPVIAAWGVHGTLNGRSAAVCSLLEFCDLHVLGLTKDGHPRHPLYVRGDAPLTLWREGR
jgi:hypothetical protein